MIELLIINSLIIFGVYASLQESFVFGKIGNWIRGVKYSDKPFDLSEGIPNLPSWIADPIGVCPICMASVYGTPVFWFAYLSEYLQYDYIIIVYIGYSVALAGLNYLILAFKPKNE